MILKVGEGNLPNRQKLKRTQMIMRKESKSRQIPPNGHLTTLKPQATLGHRCGDRSLAGMSYTTHFYLKMFGLFVFSRR